MRCIVSFPNPLLALNGVWLSPSESRTVVKPFLRKIL
jgi:hypothetical protein